MALVFKDRVKETTSTTGTGTITLAGAVSGFQSFSAIGDGNTTYYAIIDNAAWEVGLGTYSSSGPTLARTTILASSNSNAAINLAAGSKEVFATFPANYAGTATLLSSGAIDGGYTEQVYALGTSGTLPLNPSNGSIQTCSLTGAATFTDSLSSGQSVILRLSNGSTYTVTWPTTTWVTSSGNAAPTLTSVDTVVLWKINTTLYGSWVGSSA